MNLGRSSGIAITRCTHSAEECLAPVIGLPQSLTEALTFAQSVTRANVSSAFAESFFFFFFFLLTSSVDSLCLRFRAAALLHPSEALLAMLYPSEVVYIRHLHVQRNGKGRHT